MASTRVTPCTGTGLGFWTEMTPEVTNPAQPEREKASPRQELKREAWELVKLVALFLAVPAVEKRRRFENLGWALLVSVCFHILVLFFYVKFVYSTQLGAWSNEHYGAFAQNLWGFGKHLLDLPIKLALPFILWTGFYFQDFQHHLRRT